MVGRMGWAMVKALDPKLIHACKPSAKARAWIQLDLCDPAPIRGMHPPCVDDLEHVEPTLIPIAAAVPGWDTVKDTERDTYAWFTCDFRRLCSIYHHCPDPRQRWLFAVALRNHPLHLFLDIECTPALDLSDCDIAAAVLEFYQTFFRELRGRPPAPEHQWETATTPAKTSLHFHSPEAFATLRDLHEFVLHFVRWMEEEGDTGRLMAAMIDLRVYTANRSMRLAGSCKPGKQPLSLLSSAAGADGHRPGLLPRDINALGEVLWRSLPSYWMSADPAAWYRFPAYTMTQEPGGKRRRGAEAVPPERAAKARAFWEKHLGSGSTEDRVSDDQPPSPPGSGEYIALVPKANGVVMLHFPDHGALQVMLWEAPDSGVPAKRWLSGAVELDERDGWNDRSTLQALAERLRKDGVLLHLRATSNGVASRLPEEKKLDDELDERLRVTVSPDGSKAIILDSAILAVGNDLFISPTVFCKWFAVEAGDLTAEEWQMRAHMVRNTLEVNAVGGAHAGIAQYSDVSDFQTRFHPHWPTLFERWFAKRDGEDGAEWALFHEPGVVIFRSTAGVTNRYAIPCAYAAGSKDPQSEFDETYHHVTADVVGYMNEQRRLGQSAVTFNQAYDHCRRQTSERTVSHRRSLLPCLLRRVSSASRRTLHERAAPAGPERGHLQPSV